MKKIISGILGLLFLISVAWMGATYRFGIKTEEQYHALLQRASGPNRLNNLKFAGESYSRGFFTSKARTVVTVEHPLIASEEIEPIRFVLEHDISHGPFPLGGKSAPGVPRFKPLTAFIETRMVLPPDAQNQLTKVFDEIPEMASMRNYALIHLDGKGEDHFIIPAFQHTYGNESKVTVDWKGLFLQVHSTADLKELTGSMRIPGLEVSGEDGELKVREMKHVFNVHEGIRGVWLGEASFDVPGFDFVPKDQMEFQAVRMHGIGVNTTADASGENVRYLLTLQTDEVKLGEDRYGPGVFKLEARNLDAASLAKLQQTVSEVETSESRLSPEETQRKVLFGYLDILPALLKKSPELEISRLEVKTPYGDFAGTARVAVDGVKWESNPNLLKLPETLTAKVEFKAGEDLVKRLVSGIMKRRIRAEIIQGVGAGPRDDEVEAMASGMAEEQLQALTAQNVLVVENGHYRAEASYNGGRIMLNGRPLQPGDLLK